MKQGQYRCTSRRCLTAAPVWAKAGLTRASSVSTTIAFLVPGKPLTETDYRKAAQDGGFTGNIIVGTGDPPPFVCRPSNDDRDGHELPVQASRPRSLGRDLARIMRSAR